jgi:hypothetical protein
MGQRDRSPASRMTRVQAEQTARLASAGIAGLSSRAPTEMEWRQLAAAR